MQKNSPLNPMPYELLPLGDSAVIIRLGDTIDETNHRKVMALTAIIEEYTFIGMIECVPAFASVTVHYDKLMVLNSRSKDEQHTTIYETVCSRLGDMIDQVQQTASMAKRNTIEIPVCYGGQYGPDLAFVAEHNGLSEEEVIAIHSSGSYFVFMIGFAPGFPYLSGMSQQIAAPRHATPRTIIPQGSVGIAGSQTGVYPISTPGGWQLIGRTALQLFRSNESVPSLLSSGDYVRFKPITEEQYENDLAGAL